MHGDLVRIRNSIALYNKLLVTAKWHGTREFDKMMDCQGAYCDLVKQEKEFKYVIPSYNGAMNLLDHITNTRIYAGITLILFPLK